MRQYPRIESATVTVRTVYVGASADLVRGFITTPLERAIAAADGIDYIESQSIQGLSTINVRLKLNFNAAGALADVSARVDQVRADLPPEAQMPAIKIEPSDAQVAAMYLSFGSDVLQDNQVTDYLIRVVQPRLSAIAGVQRAEILGARTFALRAWLKPDRMAALNVTPSQLRQALSANNYLAAAGQTKGALVQLNVTATTDVRSVEGFKKLVLREQNGALVRLEDVADVVLGADEYDQDVRFSGEKAVFMGVWVLPNASTLDVIGRVNAEIDADQGGAADRHEGPGGVRLDVYIEDAMQEVAKTLGETDPDRDGGDLPVPRVVALGAGAGGRHSGVADRRGVLDAGVRLHAEPADAAGDRPVGRPGGRRRDRRRRERRSPPARGADAVRRRRWSRRASWSGRSSP